MSRRQSAVLAHRLLRASENSLFSKVLSASSSIRNFGLSEEGHFQAAAPIAPYLSRCIVSRVLSRNTNSVLPSSVGSRQGHYFSSSRKLFHSSALQMNTASGRSLQRALLQDMKSRRFYSDEASRRKDVCTTEVRSQQHFCLINSERHFLNKESNPLLLSSSMRKLSSAASIASLGPLRLRRIPSILFYSQSHTKDTADANEQQYGFSGVPLEGKEYKCIEAFLTEQGVVGLIILNRPKLLNALSESVMHEVVDALQSFDAMQKVGAMIITGRGKAFAAGADIKEMRDKNLVDIYTSAFPAKWNDVARIQKPIIAAVNGYALGGGCELAMMCDIILAGESAVFGQPEINLGTIPGMGGTQRLIREVGKSRAMEMILTGKYYIDAQEACRRGLASRVISGDTTKLLDEAISVAKRISEKSKPAIIMAKAAVLAAYENGLHEGMKKEKALFAATFGLEDQKEGMAAFVEKREPQFKHK